MKRPSSGVASAVALLMMLATVGCRSYERRPLDLAEYQQAWTQRELADTSVAAFAEKLQRGVPRRAAAVGDAFAEKLHERGRVSVDEFDAADGLTLSEAEAVALLLNPRLRTLRLRADVPRVSAEEAGRWADPTLSFDALRILSSVPDPWILGGGVNITLPISGRLAVEREQAWASYSAAWREAALAEWRLLSDLQAAWLRWSVMQREAELLRDHLTRLEPLERTTQQLVEAGELATTDARVLRMETARRRVELEQIEAEVQQQRVELLAMLGLAPGAAVELVPSVNVAEMEVEPDRWAEAVRAHPAVRLKEAEYEVAEQRLHREVRRQYPDLTIGPAAQWEEGQSRIGLGGTVPLPLWNRNIRRIREAEAARETARAEAQQTLQEITHRLEQLHQRREAAARRRHGLEQRVAPLIDRQLEEVRQLIELGELNVLLLEDVLTRNLATKRAMLDARLEEATAAAALRVMLQPRWAIEEADDASRERE